MHGKPFTPVTVRRRSAAQGCADAHTASAERAAVGLVESVSALGENRSFSGVILRQINSCEMCNLIINNTYQQPCTGRVWYGVDGVQYGGQQPTILDLTIMGPPLKNHSNLQ